MTEVVDNVKMTFFGYNPFREGGAYVSAELGVSFGRLIYVKLDTMSVDSAEWMLS